MKAVSIYAAKRTPIGSFLGSLASVSAPQLGSVALKAALADAKLSPEKIDEVIAGCVLTAGLGQAPARQVSIFSGIPTGARALTINKVCGSGLKAVSMACDRIQLGRAEVVAAGGMENMSQVPYLSKTFRTGGRLGHQEFTDALIHDGLWDVYNQFHMGTAAEMCAKEYKFSREAQDAYAAESYKRALKALETQAFKSEIAPVEILQKKESLQITLDEEPGRGKIDAFSKLKPAFDPQGTITAANASSINDGASFLILAADLPQAKPLARVIHHAEFAQKPEWFTTAPVGSIRKLLQEASLKVSDIASFEINEAFSVVAMAAQKELEIPAAKMNPKGGAVALGHPIGASGARILTTLIYSLSKGEKGVASLCIGGGEAISILIERV